MISMMNTTRIETVYFFLAIVRTIAGDSTYLSRGEKYGCELGSNNFSIPRIDLNPKIGKQFVGTSLGPIWKS